MDEPVGDGGSGGGVVEELSPVLEGEIGGDDGGGALIAVVEDLVEEVGAAGIEGEVAQFVDEEQLGGGPGGETLLRVLRAWEATRSFTRLAATTKRTRKPRRQASWPMALARWVLPTPEGPTKTQLVLLADEGERGRTHHDVAVDRLGVVEIVDVERGERKDCRALEGCASALLQVGAELLAHQGIKKRQRRVIARDCLLGGLVEGRGGVVEAERVQDVGQ